MDNKTLIQDAVIKAHGQNWVVETTDFISGAWYLLESLKEKGLIDFDNVGDCRNVFSLIEKEHNENYRLFKLSNLAIK
jgi:hypothetical protein